MKSTIVIYGSSTGTCQSIAETIAGKLGASAVVYSAGNREPWLLYCIKELRGESDADIQGIF